MELWPAEPAGLRPGFYRSSKMIPPDLDHLIYATPDLEPAVREMASVLGVEPTVGGSHVGLGTRNYLVSLGETSYLEIIGPDPEQPEPEQPRPFGIDSLESSRLVGWAIHTGDLEGRVASARASGFDPGEISAMSRRSPSGELRWRLTRLAEPAGGPIPFLIDWGTTPSPALDSVSGCSLLSLRGACPEPDVARSMLAALGTHLEVEAGPVALTARLRTPQGEVELR